MTAGLDRRTALLGLVSGLAATAAQAQVAPLRRSYAFAGQTISTGWRPFTFWQDKRIFVPLQINGRPVDAMLDSGVSLLVVDKTFAADLGLKRDAGFTAHGLGGQAGGDFSNGPADVDLGGLTLHSNRIAIMDLSPWSDLIGRRLDVMLGRELFDQVMVDLDFDGRQIALHDPRRFGSPPGMTALRTREAHGVRSVPLRIDGAAPVQAAFDLGAGDALSMSARYAARHRTLSRRPTATTIGYGVEGFRLSRIATIPSIELGGVGIADAPASFTDPWVNDERGGPPANLGIDTLSRFRLTTDFPRDRLWLLPRTGLGPIPKDRTGLRTARRGDQFEILLVAPEGPAAGTGLKAGDRIAALDEIAVADMPLSDPIRWNTGRVGTPLRLTLADGTRHDLVLADYY